MRKPLPTPLALVLTLALAVVPLPATAQDDPLLDLLNGRNYDRDALIEQIEALHMTVSPPTPEEPAPEKPLFLPPTAEPPVGTLPQGQLESLALILPLNSSGTALAAAETFRSGCVAALQARGAPLRVDSYTHNGSAEQAIAAYGEAVENGAQFVIGPMQRSNVAALHKAHPQAPIPTLLLQPPPGENTSDSNYYVLTIDVGEEAAELARIIRAQGRRVIVISDNSGISKRQREAFVQAWAETPDSPPLQYIYIYNPDRDWQKLFDELKDSTVEAEEADTPPTTPPPVLFAAGNGGFIRNARNFTPQGYVLYGSSIFFSTTANDKFLDNLRVMEMPWFIGGNDGGENVRDFAGAQIIIRPALQQRFYALGADACRAANDSSLWRDGWRMEGATGSLQLNENTFRRRGVLSQYNAGILKPLKK